MNLPVVTYISNIFDGKECAYLYIWASRKLNFIYIGQTSERRGCLGRARVHVGTDGTLRKNIREQIGEELELAEDLILFSFKLPRERRFFSTDTGYREAVEYLVQIELTRKRINFPKPFKIISNVRTCSRINDSNVKVVATDIVKGFTEEYARYF